MRVEIDRIKDIPLELEEEIDPSEWELDSFDVKFIKKILIKASFVRAGREILVDGTITTHRYITCSRCLKDSEKDTCQKFQLSYDSSLLKDFLEIDSDIREEILLRFPMKVLCKPDCKGLCSGCGVDLNIEVCRCKKDK